MYLKNLTFTKIKETRNGIFKHLHLDKYNDNLKSGFYHYGFIFKKNSNTFDIFVSKMTEKFNLTLHDNMIKQLQDIWNTNIHT
jgi:hypothetical protein